MEEKCNICNSKLNFNLSPNLTNQQIEQFRESLPCHNCKSISRDRMVMWTISNCISQKNTLIELEENKSIRIIEASGQRGHPPFLESKFNYLNTEFDLEAIKRNKDPNKYADFQNLHFEDNWFDFIIASEVFEHVRLDDKGFSEIYRTLKPGGYFIMTVPFGYNMENSLIRVKPEGDQDIYLLPPEYHANHTLVYRIYGRDIFAKLNKHGFNVIYQRIQIPQYGISNQEVFICRKSHIPDNIFLEDKNYLIVKRDLYPIQ